MWALIKERIQHLYVNDYQASIEHPHIGAHFLINSLNNSEIFSEILYFLFLIQTHIFAVIFLTIFKILKNRNELFKDNQIIYCAPFLTIPFISGLHTILPWLLPSISGFVLCSLAVITYIYNRNFIYIYLILFSLIFVHPFWATDACNIIGFTSNGKKDIFLRFTWNNYIVNGSFLFTSAGKHIYIRFF